MHTACVCYIDHHVPQRQLHIIPDEAAGLSCLLQQRPGGALYLRIHAPPQMSVQVGQGHYGSAGHHGAQGLYLEFTEVIRMQLFRVTRLEIVKKRTLRRGTPPPPPRWSFWTSFSHADVMYYCKRCN